MAAAEAEKPGLPQLDPTTFVSQLFWLAITYGLLYFALSKYILPRIGRALDQRKERIQRDIDQAEDLKTQTDEAIATYEKRLADARGKASAMAKDTRERLAAETEAERTKVEEQVAAKVQEAEARIAQSKSDAMREVDGIARATAGDLVTKLVGGSTTDAEIKAALDAAQSRS